MAWKPASDTSPRAEPSAAEWEEIERAMFLRVDAVLRAYGVDAPTQAERRARVGVLARMDAFAPAERAVLIAAGLL